MSLSAAKKAYRQTDAEKQRRRDYSRVHRQKPQVKAREAARARNRRADPIGAETNRKLVKKNRQQLGRNYLSELLAAQTGLRCREVPDMAIDMKREQLLVRRLAKEMSQAALNLKEKT